MTLGQPKPRRDHSRWRHQDARTAPGTGTAADKTQVVGTRGGSRQAGPDVSGVRPLPGLSAAGLAAAALSLALVLAAS